MSENNKVVYDRSSTKPFLRKGNLLVEVHSKYSLLKNPLDNGCWSTAERKVT